MSVGMHVVASAEAVAVHACADLVVENQALRLERFRLLRLLEVTGQLHDADEAELARVRGQRDRLLEICDALVAAEGLMLPALFRKTVAQIAETAQGAGDA